MHLLGDGVCDERLVAFATPFRCARGSNGKYQYRQVGRVVWPDSGGREGGVGWVGRGTIPELGTCFFCVYCL